jgi:hypothetical protein
MTRSGKGAHDEADDDGADDAHGALSFRWKTADGSDASAGAERQLARALRGLFWRRVRGDRFTRNSPHGGTQ